MSMSLFLSTTIRGIGFFGLFYSNVGEISYCVGPSMLPTFYSRDYVVIDHLLLDGYNLGDAVVSVCPTDPKKYICKRIMGMPGDLIYEDPTLINRTAIRIPPGHVWLQGDNLNNSTDSREFGPVPIALLRGKAVYRVWPSFGSILNGFDQTRQLLGGGAP